MTNNQPCIHGFLDSNWCAHCRIAGGDEEAEKRMKLITPKVVRPYTQVKDRKVNPLKHAK